MAALFRVAAVPFTVVTAALPRAFAPFAEVLAAWAPCWAFRTLLCVRLRETLRGGRAVFMVFPACRADCTLWLAVLISRRGALRVFGFGGFSVLPSPVFPAFWGDAVPVLALWRGSAVPEGEAALALAFPDVKFSDEV